MKFFKRLFVVTAVTVALGSAMGISPASAAVEANRGACMSTIDVSLKPYQAPGQTGNGPLTVVNGQNIIPTAFGGGIGCSH